jgi:uncharacterized iron-regulated protein
MKNLLAALLLMSTPATAFAAQWNGRVFDAVNTLEMTQADLVTQLATHPLIVLGEKHDTAAVQNAQAWIIRNVVTAAGMQGKFATNWEFLNYTMQAQTVDAFSRFSQGKITGEDFLQETQGDTTNATYIPILEATRDLGGELHGVNISRDDKAPVVEHGISAVNPALLPPGYAKGDQYYWDRFVVAMQGHATQEEMSNYFDAQCLTDDVLAYHTLQDSNALLRFLVAGSFHTDYFDGTVARLDARGARGDQKTVVRFFDASDYTEDQLKGLLQDPKYGPVADYVWFVNEPKPAPASQ